MQPDDPRYGDYTGPPEMRAQPQAAPLAQAPTPPPWPGYPVPGYPPGYPVAPPYLPSSAPERPGPAIAAAVLGLVNGGLLVLAGFLVLMGAALFEDIADDAGVTHAGTIARVATLLGLLDLVCAGLLIAGSILLLNRRPLGRLLATIGNGLVAATGITWLALSQHLDQNTPIVWFVLFVGLAAVAVGLTFTATTRRWLDAR